MEEKDYAIQRVKKNLEREKRSYTDWAERSEALADAWGKVTYPTKKNGEPFANLGKNFNGAVIQKAPQDWGVGEQSIHVYTKTNGKYDEDYINLYEVLSKYNKCPRAEANPERILNRAPYLNPVYILTLEEIKEDIAKRIEDLKSNAKTCRERAEALSRYEEKAIETVLMISELPREIKQVIKDSIF